MPPVCQVWPMRPRTATLFSGRHNTPQQHRIRDRPKQTRPAISESLTSYIYFRSHSLRLDHLKTASAKRIAELTAKLATGLTDAEEMELDHANNWCDEELLVESFKDLSKKGIVSWAALSDCTDEWV